MKQFAYLILAVLPLFVSCKDENSAHLKGQSDVSSGSIILKYSGLSSMVGSSKDVIVDTDENGQFDITIPLSEPTYFSLDKATLYLTPGDDLTINIKKNLSDWIIEGKGAKANIYLRDRRPIQVTPQLSADTPLKDYVPEMNVQVEEQMSQAFAQVDKLKGVSSEFKDMERARINAEVFDVYFRVSENYYRIVRNIIPKEREQAIFDFFVAAAPFVIPTIEKTNEDKYLALAPVRRNFIYEKYDPAKSIFKSSVATPARKELIEAYNVMFSLGREGINARTIERANLFIATISNQELKNEITPRIEHMSKILPGNPAIDFEMEKQDGTKVKLSDYKGALLYLDFWATWCGPCIAESPYFDALAKKYQGKDIHFIKICVSDQKSAWLKYLEEHKALTMSFFTEDTATKTDWYVQAIPRFMIIGADFNIINSDATRPSHSDIERILNDALKALR